MQAAGINANLMKFQFHKGTIRTLGLSVFLLFVHISIP